jgi:hypothetical protein
MNASKRFRQMAPLPVVQEVEAGLRDRLQEKVEVIHLKKCYVRIMPWRRGRRYIVEVGEDWRFRKRELGLLRKKCYKNKVLTRI